MGERFKPAVLKTADGQPSVSSNLTLSAGWSIKSMSYEGFCGLSHKDAHKKHSRCVIHTPPSLSGHATAAVAMAGGIDVNLLRCCVRDSEIQPHGVGRSMCGRPCLVPPHQRHSAESCLRNSRRWLRRIRLQADIRMQVRRGAVHVFGAARLRPAFGSRAGTHDGSPRGDICSPPR